jgi:CBS domain-containing protein/sugar-specific transcriptional regulator TrmB
MEPDSSRYGTISPIRFSQRFLPEMEEHHALVFKLIKACAKEDKLRLRTVREGQETCIIKNADAAFKKFNEILNSAEKEILIMTSPTGVINAWKNKTLMEKLREKGVSVKIIAPITSENLKAAKELSKYSAVKHVPACYSRVTLFDTKHLFQFKIPHEELKGRQHFENTIYTNDLEYVQRTRDMLNEIWNDALDISTVTVGSIARASVPTVLLSTHVSDVAKIMSEQNIGAVIVARNFEPLGIITERDIIERIVLANRDFHAIVAQEIMTAPLITIDSDRTIEEALEIMHKNHVRRLVVVKGENMVGLVTERRLLLSHGSLDERY